MLLNPFSPFTLLKIASLKSTVFILLILLIKANLLRLKGGLIGALFALILISGFILSSSLAVGSLAYAFNLKRNASKINTDNNDQLETVTI
tara:strand:+ start:411 stop:683 length:273 start_codon:yes stop_codon:yes gene_type:complete